MIIFCKEGGFVDLKAIERSSGGGVKTSHMRMILQALAQVGIRFYFFAQLIFSSSVPWGLDGLDARCCWDG